MNAKIPKTLAQTEFLDSSSSSNSLLETLVDLLYPVGSIYLTVGELPEVFGQIGTWERIAEGQALWTATSDGGGTIDAGLPNIKGSTVTARCGVATGKCGRDSTDWNSDEPSSMTWYQDDAGAIRWSRVAKDGVSPKGDSPTTSSSTTTVLYFDARNGEFTTDGVKVPFADSHYGKSDTVQPPAYKVYAWRRTS